MALAGPDRVRVTLARAPAAGAKPRVRYAYTGQSGAAAGPRTLSSLLPDAFSSDDLGSS